jgi:hypothetical protein
MRHSPQTAYWKAKLADEAVIKTLSYFALRQFEHAHRQDQQLQPYP